MRVRKRYLPPGWYPADARRTAIAIEEFSKRLAPRSGNAVAGIAPHAGWEFSGSIAFEVFRALREDARTIVVVGGHMGPEERARAAFEECYETPLGVIEADTELLGKLRERVGLDEDSRADNTVEVQLPFIRSLFPGRYALGLRAPPSSSAIALGEELARAAAAVGRTIAVVGSTDLTHYGGAYGFEPAGAGAAALAWVRDVNDRRMVDALASMDAETSLRLAARERSACSVGGAAAAIGFARAEGAKSGRVLRYATSSDVLPGDSFVGYAGIAFVKE